MNKEIKALYEASLIHATGTDHAGNPMHTIKQNPEKFAELIIRKCARIYWSIDNGEQYDAYVKELKKHFKVK